MLEKTHPIVVEVDGNYWSLESLFDDCSWTRISTYTGTVWLKTAKNLAYYISDKAALYKMRLYFTPDDADLAFRIKLKYGGRFDASE